MKSYYLAHILSDSKVLTVTFLMKLRLPTKWIQKWQETDFRIGWLVGRRSFIKMYFLSSFWITFESLNLWAQQLKSHLNLIIYQNSAYQRIRYVEQSLRHLMHILQYLIYMYPLTWRIWLECIIFRIDLMFLELFFTLISKIMVLPFTPYVCSVLNDLEI